MKSIRTSALLALAALLATACGTSNNPDGSVDIDTGIAADGSATMDARVTTDAGPSTMDASIVTCASPLAMCGTRCVDPMADRANCGACGTACMNGQVCNNGSCQTTCPTGQSVCNGACVTLTTDRANCGTCGTACGAGQVCGGGTCSLSCPSNLAQCAVVAPGDGGVDSGVTVQECADTQIDRRACGACGNVCAFGQECSGGACRLACASGSADCNRVAADGCEVYVAGSATNCGACGHVCTTGQVCTNGACVAPSTFRIDSLTTTNCHAIDVNDLVGDDRGGIAIAPTRVLYAGDSAFGAWNLADLTGGVTLTVPNNDDSGNRSADGFFGDLQSHQVYFFAGIVPGGFVPTTLVPASNTTITAIIPVDTVTGTAGNPIPVIPAITPAAITVDGGTAPSSDQPGVFAGYGRVIVVTNGHAYNIALPGGAMTDLGAFTLPANTESSELDPDDAAYGTAEFFGGHFYVDVRTFNDEGATDVDGIVRVQVPSGTTTTLLAAPPRTETQPGGFGDLASFTFSTTNNRWYFHWETHGFIPEASQFSETLAYCNGTFSNP